MFPVNPVILLVKGPVPSPFVVLELLVVGFLLVLQQTPLSVTSRPPSLLMLPPETALTWVIPVAFAVVSTGTPYWVVVNVI